MFATVFNFIAAHVAVIAPLAATGFAALIAMDIRDARRSRWTR